MAEPRILGPVIISAAPDAQQRLFVDGFGLHAQPPRRLSAAALRARFGIEADAAEVREFSEPLTGTGVLLVAPEPPPADSIRAAGGPLDVDALKVVDFASADINAARARLAAAGFPASEPARYPMPEGPAVAEAHVRGPDGITCALLNITDAPLAARFSRLPEAVIGDIIAVSAPVLDPAPVQAFYEQVLGLRQVYDYRVESPAFAAMIGAPGPVHLGAVNFGTDTRSQYIGIIHYGVPAGQQRSLAGRSGGDHAGLFALRILVTDVAAILARARPEQVLAATATIDGVRRARLRAPHGVVHLLEEPA